MSDTTAYRAYTKSELALLVGVSVRYLWKSVHHDRTLMDKLIEAGYTITKRTLTPRQATIIFDYYGLTSSHEQCSI